MKNFLVVWFIIFFVTSVLSLLIYVSIQQSLRIGANDPQIQMAEDTVVFLQSGHSVDQVIPKNNVNISKSLAPYIIIYDQNGNPIVGNGKLHGILPKLRYCVESRNADDMVRW